MTEGQFDHHFMELFAKGDTAPSAQAGWAALRLAALLAVGFCTSLLLA